MKKIFQLMIAVILLILYTATVLYIILKVVGSGQIDPGKVFEFSEGLVLVVNAIGGLVSAVVIANLPIKKLGQNLRFMNIAIKTDGTQSGWFKVLTYAYIAVWLIIGAGALVVGVILYPKVNQTLKDIGATWLGLLVAVGYVYFGIQQQT